MQQHLRIASLCGVLLQLLLLRTGTEVRQFVLRPELYENFHASGCQAELEFPDLFMLFLLLFLISVWQSCLAFACGAEVPS